MPTLLQLGKKCRTRKTRRNTVPALNHGPQRKAIIAKLVIFSPRKPNSAKRKVAKVKIISTGKLFFVKIPGLHGNSPALNVYNTVIMEGGSPTDTPGVNYSLVMGLEDFTIVETFGRKRRRSKFGVKRLGG